ncbi:MAG: hypothetical protein DMF84_05185 [Acidobacteria bacterium]|nr:MAG: hypothetical protein DMF84_05185 [Acidobacteriota bacterium]
MGRGPCRSGRRTRVRAALPDSPAARAQPRAAHGRRTRHRRAHAGRVRARLAEAGRLAVNVVIERFRTEQTRRQRMHDGEKIFDTLAGPTHSRDLSMDFETALEKLPDGAREIFVLHDVEGYKHHEIATMLDISAGTSKAQLHRARMMLRKHLGRA